MKECIHHGCHVLVSKGSRCEEHDRFKEYKSQRTDIVEQQFYNSSEWKGVRLIVMKKHHHLCVRCKRPADMVDHIIPLKIDWDKRLSSDNLQPLCDPCHRVKTQEDVEQYGMRLYATQTTDTRNKKRHKTKTKTKPTQSLNDFWSGDDWK